MESLAGHGGQNVMVRRHGRDRRANALAWTGWGGSWHLFRDSDTKRPRLASSPPARAGRGVRGRPSAQSQVRRLADGSSAVAGRRVSTTSEGMGQPPVPPTDGAHLSLNISPSCHNRMGPMARAPRQWPVHSNARPGAIDFDDSRGTVLLGARADSQSKWHRAVTYERPTAGPAVTPTRSSACRT